MMVFTLLPAPTHILTHPLTAPPSPLQVDDYEFEDDVTPVVSQWHQANLCRNAVFCRGQGMLTREDTPGVAWAGVCRALLAPGAPAVLCCAVLCLPTVCQLEIVSLSLSYMWSPIPGLHTAACHACAGRHMSVGPCDCDPLRAGLTLATASCL